MTLSLPCLVTLITFVIAQHQLRGVKNEEQNECKRVVKQVSWDNPQTGIKIENGNKLKKSNKIEI